MESGTGDTSNKQLALVGNRPPSDSDSDYSSDEEDDLKGPPGPLDPFNCTVGGSGFTGGCAGAPVSLYVHAKDERGRRINEGGADVEVKLAPAGSSASVEPIDVQVADKDDGTYIATFTIPLRGNYIIHVEVEGIPIRGSPFPVYFSAPMDPKQGSGAAAGGATVAGGGGSQVGQGSPSQSAAKAPKLDPPANSIAGAMMAGANMALASIGGLAGDAMSRTLYIANISPQVTLQQLTQLFGYCGKVVSLKMVGGGQDLAIVEFESVQEAKAAQGLDKMVVGDRPIKVQPPTTMGPSMLPNMTNPYMAIQMQQIQQVQAAVLQSQQLAAQVAQMRALTRTGIAPTSGNTIDADRLRAVEEDIKKKYADSDRSRRFDRSSSRLRSHNRRLSHSQSRSPSGSRRRSYSRSRPSYPSSCRSRSPDRRRSPSRNRNRSRSRDGKYSRSRSQTHRADYRSSSVGRSRRSSSRGRKRSGSRLRKQSSGRKHSRSTSRARNGRDNKRGSVCDSKQERRDRQRDGRERESEGGGKDRDGRRDWRDNNKRDEKDRDSERDGKDRNGKWDETELDSRWDGREQDRKRTDRKQEDSVRSGGRERYRDGREQDNKRDRNDGKSKREGKDSGGKRDRAEYDSKQEGRDRASKRDRRDKDSDQDGKDRSHRAGSPDNAHGSTHANRQSGRRALTQDNMLVDKSTKDGDAKHNRSKPDGSSSRHDEKSKHRDRGSRRAKGESSLDGNGQDASPCRGRSKRTEGAEQSTGGKPGEHPASPSGSKHERLGSCSGLAGGAKGASRSAQGVAGPASSPVDLHHGADDAEGAHEAGDVHANGGNGTSGMANGSSQPLMFPLAGSPSCGTPAAGDASAAVDR